MTSPTPLRDMYQQYRAQQSGSLVYRPVAEQPKARQIYVDATPKTLDQYERKATSVTDRRPGESDYAYGARQSIWAGHLQAEGAEHEARRRAEATALDVMHGRGLDGTHGMYDAADRQAYRDYAAGTRADGQAIDRLGHLASAAQGTPGQPSLSLMDRLVKRDGPVVPQRTDVRGLRSTGTGILGAGQ